MPINVTKTTDTEIDFEVAVEDLDSDFALEVIDYWFDTHSEIESLIERLLVNGCRNTLRLIIARHNLVTEPQTRGIDE